MAVAGVSTAGFMAGDLVDFTAADSTVAGSTGAAFTGIDFTMAGSTTVDFTTPGFSSAEGSLIPGGAIIRTMEITIIANPTLRRPGTIVPILPAIILT